MTRWTALAAACFATGAMAAEVPPGDVVFDDGAVGRSLTDVPGNPENGKVLMDKGSGNCIACHAVTALEDEYFFHGEVGPLLDGAGERWTEAELRGIVANAKIMFPETMMPSFYRVSGYIRPGDAYTGDAIDPAAITPLLTAQEVEDVVSYLLTLKDN